MGMIVVHHKVKNFAAWKLSFDGHAPVRKAAGLSKAHVLQAVDDPNAVTVLLDFTDAGKAKAQLGWQPSVALEDLVAEMVEADIVRHSANVGR